MKRIILSSVLFLFSANIVCAQLTAFEKTADFQVLAALFDKLYGPYDLEKTIHSIRWFTAPTMAQPDRSVANRSGLF
jgi:hypothetical protein